MLGYNFLVHGVVHCIPFLSKLWQSHNCTIDDINDDDLIEAGIKTSTDREQILKSIKEFIKQTQTETQAKSVESCDEQRAIASEPSAPSTQDPSTNIDEVKSDLSSECVICMEQTVRHHLKYKIQWQLITFFSMDFSVKSSSCHVVICAAVTTARILLRIVQCVERKLNVELKLFKPK